MLSPCPVGGTANKTGICKGAVLNQQREAVHFSLPLLSGTDRQFRQRVRQRWSCSSTSLAI